MGLFGKTNRGLFKTRNKMAGAIDDMLDSFDSFEEDLYTELEEILVMSDVGVNTAAQIVVELRDRVSKEKIKKTSEVKQELENIIAGLLDGGEDMGLVTIPSVILVIGVNGAGKTTTIGKMAAMYKAEGKKVILGAADTFRAAAIDQLDVWAQRAGVDIIKHKEGADPAAVIYDTIQAGIARDCDIIICDTAGRLHNKKNLMDELNKIYRVMDKELPYADREVLLVLDATTGQNAVNQANEFMKTADITGIVLTKLDGTARGGVVLSIKNDLKIPVKFIGVGEAIDDLQPFNPKAFARSLFESVSEEEIKKIEEGDSLSDLVNSEDYINYTPAEDSKSDTEELKDFITAVFGQVGESAENEDGSGSEGEIADAQGQTDSAPSEETAEAPEEESETAVETETADTEEPSAECTPETDSDKPQVSDDKEQESSEILKAEAQRIAAEEAAKAEAERIAAEEAAKAEAERKAAEEAAKAEAQRKAAEEAAKAEAQRKAAEEAAKAEAQRIAAEEAAKAEAQRIAAEEAAKAEAEKKAAEEAAKSGKKERRGFFGLFNRHS